MAQEAQDDPRLAEDPRLGGHFELSSGRWLPRLALVGGLIAIAGILYLWLLGSRLLPDRTLVFDCPFEVTRRRLAASGRSLDRFENEGAEFFNRVRQAYLTRAAAEPGRFRIIDATQTIANIQKQLEEALLVD